MRASKISFRFIQGTVLIFRKPWSIILQGFRVIAENYKRIYKYFLLQENVNKNGNLQQRCTDLNCLQMVYEIPTFSKF